MKISTIRSSSTFCILIGLLSVTIGLTVFAQGAKEVDSHQLEGTVVEGKPIPALPSKSAIKELPQIDQVIPLLIQTSTPESSSNETTLPIFSESEVQIDYGLGGGDVIQILVFDEPELSLNQVRVSMDGFINFPWAGLIKVEGLNTREIEEKIENFLADGYILNPQVSVLILQYASRQVFMLGAIGSPGSYELRRQTSILEMIAKGGGVPQSASQNVLITRYVNGKLRRISLNTRKLIKEGDLSLNMNVLHNDLIYFPLADVIYIVGQVKKPGPYKMNELNRTLFAAISLAGGVTKLGVAKRTKIVREIGGKIERITVNLDDIIHKGERNKDVELLPEDVVIVPETIF